MTSASSQQQPAPDIGAAAQVLADDRLYCCDNGAIYCGRHCGSSARYSGRDISGQKVMAVPIGDPEWSEFACEECGRTASGGDA